MDRGVVDGARRTSPEGFLRRHYGAAVEVSRSGRSIRVPQVCRADRQPDGTWLACDWYGQGIGDTIALVRQVSGCGFVEAVAEVTGDAHVAFVPAPGPPPRPLGHPRVPRRGGVPEGRDYLLGRGISARTISLSEACGALSYCKGGVLFLGREDVGRGQPIRSVTIRYLRPRFRPGDASTMTKRDLEGSDKRFPFLLPGGDGRVVIVEGGVDALAAADMASAACTVIATGGVGMRSWIRENARLREVVAQARLVEIWGENEISGDGSPDPVKQARTDAMRVALAEEVGEARGGDRPLLVYPPVCVKDAADWNERCPTYPGSVVEVIPDGSPRPG